MSTYLSKTIRAVIALGILVFLGFAIGSSKLRSVPIGVLKLGLCVATTYAISLFIRDEVPLMRRLGTAFLAFIGITYIIPAALGLIDNSDFVVTDLWDGLLNPYLLVWLSGHSHAYVQSLPNSSYYFMPHGVNAGFSYSVMAISFIAIIGALSLARSNRVGLAVWIVLMGGSVWLTGCYWYMGIHSWGLSEIHAQLFWEASYLGAFFMAIWRVKWGEKPTN